MAKQCDSLRAFSSLNYLFAGGRQPSCLDAADANDDGTIDVSDAVQILLFLFAGGTTLPEPYPELGIDLTPDPLRCDSYPQE